MDMIGGDQLTRLAPAIRAEMEAMTLAMQTLRAGGPNGVDQATATQVIGNLQQIKANLDGQAQRLEAALTAVHTATTSVAPDPATPEGDISSTSPISAATVMATATG